MGDTQGQLIIVSTPIGNLGDMTPRALEALEQADAICAEDTRVTGKLLSAFALSTRLERLDENLMGQRSEALIQRVLAGETIAYCTDAGMPGVSDPGLRLVAAARAAGARVEVLPGASAASTAYVSSGCTNPRYYFGGFFPRKEVERTSVLSSLRSLDAALIFYESPNRIASALEVVARVFPHRQLAVCRELTKIHEEVVRGMSTEVAAEFARRADEGTIRGEFVLVIDGPSQEEGRQEDMRHREDAAARVEALRAEGLSNKDMAKRLAHEYGISRNDAYAIVLSH